MVIDRYKTNQKNRGKRTIKFFIFLFFVVALVAVAVYFFLNKDTIMFHFKKDKYSLYFEELEKQKQTLQNKIILEQKDLDKLTKFAMLLHKLKSNNASDPLLYFLEGSFWYYRFEQKIIQDPEAYSKHIFNQFIKRNHSHQRDEIIWRKALFNLRKASLLKLPKIYRATTTKYITNLYFWDNYNYWPIAQMKIPTNDKSAKKKTNLLTSIEGVDITILTSLFTILVNHSRISPRWKLVKQRFGINSYHLWRGIYFLNQGNTPLSFNNLQKIVKTINPNGSENNFSTQTFYINNAFFLLAKIMKKQHKKKRQLYYFSKIDLAEFLPRHKWFLGEYFHLLNFFGERRKAKSILRKYEKLTL